MKLKVYTVLRAYGKLLPSNASVFLGEKEISACMFQQVINKAQHGGAQHSQP